MDCLADGIDWFDGEEMIHTVYYDNYGRKVSESIETDADRRDLPRPRKLSGVPQVGNLLKGAQRRPARRDTRLQ